MAIMEESRRINWIENTSRSVAAQLPGISDCAHQLAFTMTVLLLKRLPEDIRDALVRLLAPMTPHLCEEIWERLGHGESVFSISLPQPDARYVKDESFDLVIQVNSKIRARESIPADTDPERMKEIALAHPRILEALAGRAPRRVIVIQNRLVNIVL